MLQWANLWPDKQKSHIRPQMRVRLLRKPKPNNCTESSEVNAAGIRGKECVSTRGGLAGASSRHIQKKKRVVTTNCQKSAEAIVPGKKPGRAEQSLVREKDRRRSMR